MLLTFQQFLLTEAHRPPVPNHDYAVSGDSPYGSSVDTTVFYNPDKYNWSKLLKAVAKHSEMFVDRTDIMNDERDKFNIRAIMDKHLNMFVWDATEGNHADVWFFLNKSGVDMTGFTVPGFVVFNANDQKRPMDKIFKMFDTGTSQDGKSTTKIAGSNNAPDNAGIAKLATLTRNAREYPVRALRDRANPLNNLLNAILDWKRANDQVEE